MPRRSAVATDSSSRIEPPVCTTAVTPPAAATSMVSGNGMSASEAHTLDGDRKLREFDRAPTAAKTDLIIDGIDDYVAALRKDPFNARATLKLALAYDRVHRKGCALVLLQRLEQLAQNPKFANEAIEAIDEVEQRRKWFEAYRREALRRVGRTGP